SGRSRSASGPRARTDMQRDRRLDSLRQRVRQGDIGLFRERVRLWRRDPRFFLWHGLRLLRLRLALLTFTLGIQNITHQRGLLRFPPETPPTRRSLLRTAGDPLQTLRT